MRTQWRQAALAQALRASLCLFALPLAAAAQQGPAVQTWNVEAGSLQQAISRVMRQGRLTISYPSALVAGKTTRGLSGMHTPRAALERLLEGTGIEVEAIDDTSFVLRREESAPKAESPSGQASKRTAPPAAPGQATRVDEPIEISPVQVTGTRIRGGSTPSPVITIAAENIQEEGFTDLGQVVRSLPQNFSGGQNPGVSSGNLSGAGNANQNITGGSGLNLRGLGPDATLTLLNGRRMAYGGFVQAVDISAIPVEAVERIEIVADGASAIYGSDAVGGVGNVILRRDYDGVTIGTRYGGATRGGLTTREYTATGGIRWSTGGLIATYKNTSADPIYARERSFTGDLPVTATLYPSSDTSTGLFSAYQSLGDNIEIRLDALRTVRDQFYAYVYTYESRVSSEGTTSLVSPSVTVSLPRDWTLSLAATWAQDKNLRNTMTGVDTVLADVCYCNDSQMYDIGFEGPLFSLPGGDARLAIGAGHRENEFLYRNHLTSAIAAHGDEGSSFAYAELNLPLVGAETAVRGVHRLLLTAAIRGEDHDSFGRVTTPKIGLIYSPTANFSFRTSWGRSFKAPTLFERNYEHSALLYLPMYYGATDYEPDDTILIIGGGNPGLKPERAETLSTTLSFHPEWAPGFTAEVSVFHIDYTDRVVQPVVNQSRALSDPIYAPFVVRSPSEGLQAAAIANTDTFYNFAEADYDPGKVLAILYTQYANVARQEIQGVDLSGSYRFGLGGGSMTMRGSAAWLDSRQQTTPAQSTHDLSGTLFNPARLNTRMGAVWNRGDFSASVFASYTGGVMDTLNGEDGGSFTTFDTTLRYSTGQRGDVLSGLEFTLAAQNLFDRAPPSYATDLPGFALPYDSTNYPAIGRFLSISVSKRF